jgi:hypothetical protein
MDKTIETVKARQRHIAMRLAGAEGHYTPDFVVEELQQEHDALDALLSRLGELEAENAKLQKEVAAANRGAKTASLVNQSMAKKLMTFRPALIAARDEMDRWTGRLNWALVACDIDRDARNEITDLGIADAIARIDAALAEGDKGNE